MALTNTRKQYAVGQGFFHAGELEDGAQRLRYVVDCGAMSKYAKQRDERIDSYLGLVGAKGVLDLLYISHAHADHLNGVERLLDKTDGLVVGTIVLPLLRVEDRLIAYARAAWEEPASTEDPFYQDFVLDPVLALGRFKPDRIVLVRPGDRATGAPFSGGLNSPRDGPENAASLTGDDRRLGWKLIGEGVVTRRPDWEKKGGVRVVAEVSDTVGLACTRGTSSATWLLAPFVDPAVKASSGLFMSALADELGMPEKLLQKWLRKKANFKKLLTSHVAQLRDAYSMMHPDLNVTSLTLFSGPLPEFPPLNNRYRCHFGTWRANLENVNQIAWLGTGDAALGDKKRREAFFKHYGKLLDGIATMTLPHHGSEHNFDASLLGRIKPRFPVAAADRFGKWRHPGTSVTQAVASTGHFLLVVTANAASEIAEVVAVG